MFFPLNTSLNPSSSHRNSLFQLWYEDKKNVPVLTTLCQNSIAGPLQLHPSCLPINRKGELTKAFRFVCQRWNKRDEITTHYFSEPPVAMRHGRSS
ncbi:hypothetical protein TNCV_5119301 [Trichonephila clavipes]|nr:hypothetical protein TNCV_5119301 [Trichonephila clavipes]